MQKIKFILPFFICFFCSCKDSPFAEKVYSVKLYNNTSEIVVTFFQKNYPDTSLPLEMPFLAGVRPNDFTYIDSKQKWEQVFSESPKDTLSFFIINRDTLIKYSWNGIQSRYKIAKRYDVSLKDMTIKNWQIIYP